MAPNWTSIKRVLAAPAGALSLRLGAAVCVAFIATELLRPSLGVGAALVGAVVMGAALFVCAILPCKRTHERLVVSEHQRERLATMGAAVGRIAHDLRNSLATAQLISGRLAESDDARVRLAAPRMERAITRAVQLAEAASRYGKAEDTNPAPRQVSVTALLETAVAAFGKTAPHIALTTTGGELAVRADPELCFRIFDNLLRNAAAALARGDRAGRVWIEAARAGPSIVIDVCDNGPGLSEAARERLFQPFAVDDGSLGAGLGLAVARELARLQSGDVQLLASSALGAAFRVTLPSA
jgi:signal transduction histidine kinase